MSDLGDAERNRLRRSFEAFTEGEGGATPLYARLSEHIAESRDILDLYATVDSTKRKPVMLFAAVHYLLLSGTDHELMRVYEASDLPRSLERAPQIFSDFCAEYEDDIVRVMKERSIQTNEVNRMTAFLPAFMYVHQQVGRPLSLVEVGASAGLNLLFDRYRYDYTNGPAIGLPGAAVRLHSKILAGRPPFQDPAPPVDYRIGIDLEPVDLMNEDSLVWLRACIFAGDVARDLRLRAAADLARREWVEVRKGDALTVLPTLIPDVPNHTELVVFNSWTMGWMTSADRQRLVDLMAALGARRPIWWITYEQTNKVPGITVPDHADSRDSLLSLHHCSHEGIQSHVLARVHPHGAWIDWLGEPSF